MTARPAPALLLVTGSRDFKNRALLDDVLDHAWTGAKAWGFTELVVIHGGARGADQFADDWARRHKTDGVHWRRFPADWEGPCTAECEKGHRRKRRDGRTYCPAEGNRRNQRMVEHVRATGQTGGVLGLAFFVAGLPCRGTHDCARRIEAADIPLRRITAQRAGAVSL